MFPSIIERLRGMPPRLEEATLSLPQEILTLRAENGWSIQEHAGHFLDTEELWQKRLEDFLTKREILTDADLTHRKTKEANHNANTLGRILNQFRAERFKLVERLEQITEEEAALISRHPRLNKPIRLIDSCYFTADHDDYYMVLLRRLIMSIQNGTS
ncbi:MAG: DinB family protein [Bacteroidota bacterium]